MPTRKSVDQELHDLLLAVWTADANKLGQGESQRGVRVFDRLGTDREIGSPPYLLTFIRPDFGELLGGATQVSIDGSFHLFMDPRLVYTPAQPEESVIAEGIRLAYDGVALTGTDWTFSNLHLAQQTKRGAQAELVISFRTMARPASEGSAWLWGWQAKMTFTGAESLPITNDCRFMQNRMGVTDFWDFRPAGDLSDWGQWLPSNRGGDFILEFGVKGGNEPCGVVLPKGVTGTLTVFRNKDATTVGTWTGSVYLEMIDHLANGDNPQTARYRGRWTGAITEDIT